MGADNVNSVEENRHWSCRPDQRFPNVSARWNLHKIRERMERGTEASQCHNQSN